MSKKDLVKAVRAHYESVIARQKATLHMYLNDPLAVADHSNIVEEIIKLNNELASAEESLNAFDNFFVEDEVESIIITEPDEDDKPANNRRRKK